MWIPMLTLPNIEVLADIKIGPLTIASSNDQRVRQIAKAHPNFRTYLRSFHNEFGIKKTPSIILRSSDSPESYRSFEALAGFRDALAAATIPYAWSQVLYHENNFNIRYADWFTFFPWNLDTNYEHIIMNNMAQWGLHEAKALRNYGPPGISHLKIDDKDLDQPILSSLLERWEKRFLTTSPDWRDVALFRSLNTALAAMMMPTNTAVMDYDIGRTVGLWVSAFELLAHPGPGGKLKFSAVYDLLDQATWFQPELATSTYEPNGFEKIRPRRQRTLPVWLYGELHRIRNDFLHGNPITDARMIVAPAKRPLHLYAPLLYRMALSAFLNIQNKNTELRMSGAVTENDVAQTVSLRSRQRAIELGISTALYTSEEHREAQKARRLAFQRSQEIIEKKLEKSAGGN